jgi:hypothetical protein
MKDKIKNFNKRVQEKKGIKSRRSKLKNLHLQIRIGGFN